MVRDNNWQYDVSLTYEDVNTKYFNHNELFKKYYTIPLGIIPERFYTLNSIIHHDLIRIYFRYYYFFFLQLNRFISTLFC